MKEAWSLRAELKEQRESLLEDHHEAGKECRKYDPLEGEYWEEYRQLKLKYATEKKPSEEEKKSLEDMKRRLDEGREKAHQRLKEVETSLEELDDQFRALSGE